MTDPLPPDVLIATKIPTKYGEVAILKSETDPLCTRISIGGNAETGYYCNYRGYKDDVYRILEIILEALDDPKLPADLT
jgi:hypothetical protein